jgi:hypothetical protein
MRWKKRPIFVKRPGFLTGGCVAEFAVALVAGG